MLSLKNRLQKINTLIVQIALTFLYISVFATYLFGGSMYIIRDTYIEFTPYFNLCPIFGMFCAVICFVSSILNRKNLARNIFTYVMFFSPLEFLLLFVQYMNPYTVFSTITYLLPFIVFYVLFHSNPYDEITGCQNRHSYETRFMHAVKTKQSFLIIDVVFPKLNQNNDVLSRDKRTLISAEICRRLESIQFNANVFSTNSYSYIVFIPIKKNAIIDIENIVKRTCETLEQPISVLADNSHHYYKMVAFRNNSHITSTSALFSMQKYLFSKLDNNSENEHYIAIGKDYEDFYLQYRVEKLLLDIKTNYDLNDSRVLCYAQPIYSVGDNEFRTAEALMRLELDGKIIYPDKFITQAENNGSIHTLTCIMLNKICQKIVELSPSFDFDAITINCSTTEMSDRNSHKELLNIIHRHDIPCSKIRFELTESAMCDNYDNVIHNIEQLRQSGVYFYLDDFGTGYSNLERIITCPFQTIKFDKSLLYKAMKDNGVDDLVSSMVEVFKNQGFVLLVEGVEDESQSEYSVEKGFNYIQGYKYAKPVPVEELTKYFTEKKE